MIGGSTGHRYDLSDVLVINFKSKRMVADCDIRSWWGLDGERPTHCHDHSPLKEGLVRPVNKDSGEASHRASSCRFTKGRLL